ncbi:MAG TPA: ATP synthase F1 subunit gamma [Thermomicrobiales bacterium]|nr:ATP synthase F1 subunit gamma [Thermomicrobiales bacterium]
MPSPREINRRRNAVKNMTQITRAMEMVAASKMRRAQDRVTSGRPYSERLRQVLGDLASLQLDADQLQKFPLLEQREVDRTAMILITPDRGLAGALNSNILRRAVQYIRETSEQPPQVIAVGKKGRDFAARTNQDMIAEFIQLGDRPSLDAVRPIAQIAINEFLAGHVDAVHIVYPQFINTMTQRPEVLQLLPIVRPEGDTTTADDFIFEPSPESVLQQILPRYVEINLYQAVLENIASFYSAQMVAMHNATDNAKELVQDLNLAYNKARQAKITNEVAEIAAGANAFRT